MNRRPELIPVTIDGDLRRGGYLAAGRVEGDTDAVRAGLNWRIMGRCESGWIDAEREVFNGHVLASPDFSFDRYSSQVTFQAGTADALLTGHLQDLSFTEQASPANVHQMTGLLIGKIVQHIMQKHCNFIHDPTGAAGSPEGIISLTDVDTTDSTAVDIYNVSQSDNFWRAVQQIGGGEEGGGEFYRPYFNRYNKFFYRQAPPFLDPKPAARGTLDKSLIRGTVGVKFNGSQPNERIGQVTIVAVKNNSTVYESVYPEDPLDGKILRPQDGIWAHSQARADLLAERLFKWKTRLYTLTVEVDPGLVLWGDDGRGLDLGDRVLVAFDGPAEDLASGAGVHLNLAATSFFVYGINLSYDQAERAGKATLTLEHDNS